MKIKIKSKKAPALYFIFPTCLFCRPLLSWALPKMPQIQACSITRQQVLALAEALNDFRKHHKRFLLLEAESADGTTVAITL